ncbi:MAG: hypothetical protein JWM00_221 [Candidatus Saccharibacteria bacterium]|nr:hypothetical protein [Candidatus Saccharibacteria bacterium]
MNTLDAFIIIGVAALIHASFQLGVSVLTLLGSHTIGKNRSHAKLLRLTGSYLIGTAVMTMLLVSMVSLTLLNFFPTGDVSPLIWAITCGLLIGLGVAVWAFYYRREQGTSLWLPRGLASYLAERTKATHLSGEAFGLGLSSVIAELLFIVGPILLASLALVQLPPVWQLVGVAGYTFISLLSLLIVAGLIGSGHKLSQIQKWREDNKYFLQFVGGGGLMVLGLYVYVQQVVAAMTATGIQ